MTELGRFTDGTHDGLAGFKAAQMNDSQMEPLAIKAFHLHKRQTDVWDVPPTDKLLLVLGDLRAGLADRGARTALRPGRRQLAPRAHPAGRRARVKNLMPAKPCAIIYFVDVKFSTGADCDEGRLPWDFFGADVWDVERG